MSTTNLQDAMKNPARLFGTPESLESSTELTAGQKYAALPQWKNQLERRPVPH